MIDARGNMVLPGFQDTHVHVPEAGINEHLCILESGKKLAAYEKLAANCAAELPIDVPDRAIPNRPALSPAIGQGALGR